jgi:hypothetical protein
MFPPYFLFPLSTVILPLNLAILPASRNDDGGQQACNRFFTRNALPPPRRSGLRFPPPVGHGRGLASRPGCAVPGEGVGLPCLRLCLPRCATLETRSRNLRRSACARLHPRPRNRRSKSSPTPPAASRCSRRSRLSLSASDSASPTQAELLQTIHFCNIHRRQPTRLRSLPSRITPLFLPAIATAREAATATKMPSSGRCREIVAPQNISANTLAHPIIGTLCKVAVPFQPCHVYSPLSLRLRLHNADDYPTCQRVASAPDRISRCACVLCFARTWICYGRCRLWSGVSPWLLCTDRFRRSALSLATRR